MQSLNGKWDIHILKQIDQMILAGERRALARAHVLGPDDREQLPAGVYWVRASVDRNILLALGRDPAAMTRREYHRQGVSFAALCAAAIFENDLAAEKARSLPRPTVEGNRYVH